MTKELGNLLIYFSFIIPSFLFIIIYKRENNIEIMDGFVLLSIILIFGIMALFWKLERGASE